MTIISYYAILLVKEIHTTLSQINIIKGVFLMFKTRKKAISLLLVFSLIFSSLIFCTPYASAKNADELGTELNPYVLSPGEKITVTIDGSKNSDISTLADETFPSCILTTWYDGTYFHWSVKPMFTGANFSGSTNVMRNGIFQGEVYFSGFSGQRRVYKDEMIRLSGTLTQHFLEPTHILRCYYIQG